MNEEILRKRLTSIANYVTFEGETAQIWPWAVPADEILQSKETLTSIAETMFFYEDGSCETDELHEELVQAFGLNPALEAEQELGRDMAMLEL